MHSLRNIFDFENATAAYDLLLSKKKHLAMLFKYSQNIDKKETINLESNIDNIQDNTFIESSEEKDTYMEYMIEKILKKLDFKQKESCKVFSINEVADMLKVSKRTIEGHLYDKRDLPYLKIGRKVRITKSDLESFLGFVS